MSLGRLLAAGKTLVSSGGGGGRYRLSKQRLLPKFVSPKNPFVSSEASAKSPAPANGVSKSAAELKRPELPPAGGRFVAEANSITMPKPAVAVAAREPAKETEKKKRLPVQTRLAHGIAKLGEWGKKLNPFSRRLQKPAPSKSVALQEELSLDAVRVVRNDLTDADCEGARSAARRSVSPVKALATGTLEPVGAAWERITTKFLGDQR